MLAGTLLLPFCYDSVLRYPNIADCCWQTSPAETRTRFENQQLEEPLRIDLKSEVFRASQHDERFLREEVCSICLQAYVDQELVVSWKGCGHLFHKDCIEDWVLKRSTCPMCKKQYI